MTRLELLQFLRECETMGVLFLPRAVLRSRFEDESDEVFERTLRRHVRSGLIEHPARGLYASPRAGLDARCPWARFIAILRPLDALYLSLETRLAEVGAISQQPQVVTLVTTGFPGVLDTLYGRIELVHSSRVATVASRDIVFDEGRGVYIASPRRAFQDMVRLNRSAVDLVDAEDLDEAQDEFEQDLSRAAHD